MHARLATCALFALFLLGPDALAQGAPAALPAPLSESEARIWDDLEDLSDRIGPRLTGSPALSQAVAWAEGRFQDASVDRVWRESWFLEHPWRRGPISVHLVEPYAARLNAVAWGWTPGTEGPRRGPVVPLSSRTNAAFDALYAGRIRGAWVMTFPPARVVDPALPNTPSPRVQAPTVEETTYQNGLRRRLIDEGVAGVVKDAARPDGLLQVAVTDSPARPYPLPVIVLPHETYAQFARLLQRERPVVIEADIENEFPTGPVAQENVFAEIAGRSRSRDYVLVAAHLDSWDLATGASDNGAGVVSVLEAARRLSHGPRPRRTIRFALFTGEEQGSLGARAFVRAQRNGLGAIVAVLVQDAGAGPITGISLEGRTELRSAWLEVLERTPALQGLAIVDHGGGSSDQIPFVECGVPGFQFVQEELNFARTLHSQIDTLDHVAPQNLSQAANVLAATAYALADAPTSALSHVRAVRTRCSRH